MAFFLIQIVFHFLFEAVGIQHESNFKIVPAHNLTEYLILIKNLLLVVIFAPLLETLIFQTFLFFIFIEKLKSSTRIFIIGSAILFGLAHYRGYIDIVIVGAIICLVFNYIYAVLREMDQPKKAFWTIVFIHSIVNTIGILLNLTGSLINI